MKKFYITSPLYYVNDVPHVGSAYTTIACDSIARFYRLKGFDTCFLTGTDEHGKKIAKAAEKNGKSPQEHCNYIANEFKRLWEILNIQYDHFSRTTSEKHKSIVKEFFNIVFKNGDIYEGSYEGLYCEACEDFWNKDDLINQQICPTHKTEVQEYKEKNYFFALSKYQDKLIDHINKNPDFIQPSFRKNEVLGWIKEGLRDFPISRESVKWGIPVPIEEKQTIYVWFDALLGYISGLLNENEKENINLNSAIKKYWAPSVHVIGKDILRFHAVYWPCMLMSAGIELPQKVFGHGFLTKDGEKMGKTTGNTIDPYELVKNYGTDSVRYFFLKEISFGKDGDFTYENFLNRVNSDLANNLGNLLNRSLNLINKNFNSEIDFITSIDKSLEAETNNTIKMFEKNMLNLEIKEALDHVWKLIDLTNKNFNDRAPWKMIKNGDLENAKACLYETLEILRNIAILVYPVIPNTSLKMCSQLGYTNFNPNKEWDNLGFNKLKTGFKINQQDPIFPRLELIQ